VWVVTNYQKGRAFEYQLKKFLERFNYFVFRMAGSHSPFDLIAIRGDKIEFIQAKELYNKSAKNYVIKKVEQDIKNFIIQQRELGNDLIGISFRLYLKIDKDRIYLYELKDMGDFNLQLQLAGFYDRI